MAIETVHDAVFGLTYILLFTYVTCQSINQVIALTGDIGRNHVSPFVRQASNSASFVEFRAMVATIWSVAIIVSDYLTLKRSN